MTNLAWLLRCDARTSSVGGVTLESYQEALSGEIWINSAVKPAVVRNGWYSVVANVVSSQLVLVVGKMVSAVAFDAYV